MKIQRGSELTVPLIEYSTMSSNAKFREMGPFSLKIDIKTSGTTFDLIKNASESFWKFGLLTLRPFGLWPLRPS